MNIKKLLTLAGIAALPAVGFAFDPSTDILSYSIFGISDPDVGDISADVLVDFTAYNSLGDITITVENTGPTTSQITGFYLLRPIISGGANLTGESVGTVWDPATWDLESSLDTQLTNFNYNGAVPTDVNNADYFGASLTSPPEDRLDYDSGTAVGDIGVFTFNFGFAAPAIDYDAWFNSVDPHVYIRWQNIGDFGEGASGKGFDTVVPEPRLIAPLAVLGLGGLLWTRRRFTKKQK